MKSFAVLVLYFFVFNLNAFGQSISFKTYMNPVQPGDHPDRTLTKVGKYFYSTGSSFNPTPVIYRSTDLVHWEAVAQPVSASWSQYGDNPGGGCWGGKVVYYNNKWWDFFSHAGNMYFVTADSIKGNWTLPTKMICPSVVPGLGYDNSIFIDTDGSWYLLVKNGQVNNWIVQLGNDGQPNGKILNLTWLNPSPSYPYSWAEGPVMWKHDGYYYYSFARDVSGGQYVMRSKTLTDNESAWTTPVNLFNLNDPNKSNAVFINPNHSSAVVTLKDGTNWLVTPGYRVANNNEWWDQGRQLLLLQVHYNSNDMPVANYPDNLPNVAPKLPSSGIPWLVPHTDFFNSSTLNPQWSFLGYTPSDTYSLTKRSGWLWLAPKGKPNTIINIDGEHNHSLITRLDFDPKTTADQAGLWIFNGAETLHAKLCSTVDQSGKKVIDLSYDGTDYQSLNTAGNVVWLKLVRVNHELTGYWSADGFNWTKVGSVDVSKMDGQQPNFGHWTGNRLGMFVQNSPAYFNLFIYRDAYTPILAECPANQFGTKGVNQTGGTPVLDNIENNNWAMYASVEFGGNNEYPKSADSIKVVASSATNGGLLKVYVDSIAAGTKIAECPVTGTGSWTTFKTFTAKLSAPVTGSHDVYLVFSGTSGEKLFMMKTFQFTGTKLPTGISGNNTQGSNYPQKYSLKQNYPNPFNPTTIIEYYVPKISYVSLKVYNVLGQFVTSLYKGYRPAGNYTTTFNADNLASGVYLYQLTSGNSVKTKKMLLIK